MVTHAVRSVCSLRIGRSRVVGLDWVVGVPLDVVPCRRKQLVEHGGVDRCGVGDPSLGLTRSRTVGLPGSACNRCISTEIPGSGRSDLQPRLSFRSPCAEPSSRSRSDVRAVGCVGSDGLGEFSGVASTG
jgi:hypothetical protein